MKLNKDQTRAIIAVAVVFAAYNVLAFALPFRHTGVFWVGYVFGLLALIAALLIFALAFGKDGTAKSKFYGFPIARLGVIYLAVQLPLSFLAMALAGIEVIPAWPFTLVFILLLAAVVLGTIAADTTRDEIVRQDAVLKKNVGSIRALRSLGSSLVSQCGDEEAKKELRKLSDSLNYCDPVSSDATAEAEAELNDLLGEIQRSLVDGDNGSILPLCRKAQAVLAERNRLCKLNK